MAAVTDGGTTGGETGGDRIPVGVIGCGRMGRLHARVYSQMPRARLVGVFDAVPDSASAVAGEFNCRAFADLPSLLDSVRAVTIAVPTQLHLSVADACISRGIACLIEKPLAGTVEECRRIVELARGSAAPVQTGHIERFNPAVVAMNRLGIHPRFIEVVRVSPMTFRSLDVGVVLDMMIHDIDIVLRLAGSSLEKVDAVGVSALGGAEDICNARLVFANGCVANMTASRLALKTERKLRVFASDAYVSLDYHARKGICVRRTAVGNALRDAIEKLNSGQVKNVAELDYTKLVNAEQLVIDDVEPLRAELDSFLDAVSKGHRPEVSAEDGLAAVDTAHRIVAAMGVVPTA
jgi:predicted dehydrogenase